jgi:bifunctional UDP-N-acetylglucosamine pyrophosphorylase/glucosamine-1-phosphate N-acetyltransferase
MAAPALGEFEGTLLVVSGDVPLLRPATLHELLVGHRSSGAAVTVLSTRVPDAKGYGRIIRPEGGGEHDIAGIVEDRDATPAQKAIDEINSGIYAFDYPALAAVLDRLSAHNAQGEYYLTDTVRLLLQSGRTTAVVCAPDYRELLGINTVAQLAEAEQTWHALQERAAPREEAS